LIPISYNRGYGCVKAAISLFFVLFLSASQASAKETKPSGNQYLDTLLKTAKERHLNKDRYWEVLLHYKHAITGVKSLIDDPRFFLSPDGKHSPDSELEATIRAFFESKQADDSHARCRFPARYEWLRQELGIDESKLPAVSCREFDDAYSKIKPKSAVLVFPAAYINGPASTFGHTLIRIDSDYQSKLLSYAVTYSAFADDTNGALYAFKGIFGFYKGYFTILPYYEKIKEYNDLEQRDIWEYNLKLSEEETSRMLLHLWELKDIYSYYYFFDENCSYTLLFLLEAARPSLHLTDEFNKWVIPIDTLRAVKSEELIESVVYRPSKGTKIRHISSLIDETAQRSAKDIAETRLRPQELDISDPEENIKVLDLAAEAVQFKYNKKELSKEEYQKEFLTILKARSELGRPGDADYKIPVPLRPEEGHGSSRLSLGMGFRKDESFQEIRYRAAQHELSDPDGAYIEGSEIVFFGVAARIPHNAETRLESLDVIDIVSISPWDKFFKPISWKVKTGLLQKTMPDGKDGLIYQLNPGGGFAFKNDLTGLYYIMFESDLNVGGSYKDNYSLGLGPSIGVIRKITGFWKMNIFANALYYELGDNHKAYKAMAQQVIRVSRNNSLNLDLSWKREYDIDLNELKLNWNLYF
jgi:hypothetical protein